MLESGRSSEKKTREIRRAPSLRGHSLPPGDLSLESADPIVLGKRVEMRMRGGRGGDPHSFLASRRGPRSSRVRYPGSVCPPPRAALGGLFWQVQLMAGGQAHVGRACPQHLTPQAREPRNPGEPRGRGGAWKPGAELER